MCFLILLLNSSLSILKYSKSDQEQKMTYSIAAKGKTNNEKNEKKKYFFDQEMRRIAKKKYLEVKAE